MQNRSGARGEGAGSNTRRVLGRYRRKERKRGQTADRQPDRQTDCASSRREARDRETCHASQPLLPELPLIDRRTDRQSQREGQRERESGCTECPNSHMTLRPDRKSPRAPMPLIPKSLPKPHPPKNPRSHAKQTYFETQSSSPSRPNHDHESQERLKRVARCQPVTWSSEFLQGVSFFALIPILLAAGNNNFIIMVMAIIIIVIIIIIIIATAKSESPLCYD